MVRMSLLLVLLASPAPALAQQQPDPTALQKAVAVLQQQRNQALDQVVGANVEIQRLSDENTKLKADIDALKKGAKAK